MNSVYDRPLFANKKQKRRDARTKLLNMGGIVASSPELMQAVSQAPRAMNQGGYIPGYDKGGHVHPHASTRGQLSRVVEEQTTSMPLAVNANPLMGLLNQGLGALGFKGGNTDYAAEFEKLKKMFGRGEVDVSEQAGSESFLDQSGKTVGVNPRAFDVEEEVVVENNDMFGTEDVKVSPDSMDAAAKAEFERMDAVRKEILEIQNSDASPDNKAGDTADLLDIPLVGTDEEKYLQYKKMMETAFGKKANAKTMAGLNKQLVGFSMAAGKDPRAVVNIANALKEGAQIAKADLQLDQARSDKITEKAMDRMFTEKDATASSKAAMDRAKFTAGARLKAALISSGARKGRTTSDFVQNVLTEALKNYNLDSQIVGKDEKGNDINESVSQYLDRIVEDTLQSYEGAMGGSSNDTSTNGGSSSVADQHKTANDGAKQKGQTRYQINGEFFDVQK